MEFFIIQGGYVLLQLALMKLVLSVPCLVVNSSCECLNPFMKGAFNLSEVLLYLPQNSPLVRMRTVVVRQIKALPIVLATATS